MENLILGDSTVEIKKFTDNQFDTVLTSPPYNRTRNDKYSHFTDINKDYFNFLVESVEQCLRVCKGERLLQHTKNGY